MTPLNLFLIQFAVAEFAIVALLLYILCGSLSSADGMEGRIRDLENKIDNERSYGRAVASVAAVYMGKIIQLEAKRDRLKAENESLVASVNYWKNATKATP